MTCTRGCQGVSIESALFCQFKFTQGCGGGCDGLTDGQSRIQFNATGELEVYSNVGGICTAVSIGGTDTLVDNNDGTATHTALDGTVVTLDICKMLCDAPCISADDCNGVECRVDGLYVNNDIQALNAQASLPIEGPVGTTLPPSVATAVQIGTTVSLTVANPSICNPMTFYRTFGATSITFRDTCGAAPSRIFYMGEWSNNGGATWIFTTQLSGEAVINLGDTVTLPIGSFVSSFTQAVGGSNQLDVRFRAYNPDGNFCGDILLNARNITAMGINYIN